MRHRFLIATMIAFLTVISMTRALFSQEAQSSVSGFDPGKLRSFARVYVQFEKIRETYLPRLKNSQSVRETDEIEKEARTKIAEALKREGLTPESYSQIVKELNNDGALRAKAIQLIDEERKKT